jgi:hypothetical protein
MSRSRWAPTADWCWLEADLPRGVRNTPFETAYSSHRIGSRATKNMGTIALDYTTHCLWLPLFAQIGTVPLWLITALTSLQKRWRQYNKKDQIPCFYYFFVLKEESAFFLWLFFSASKLLE